MTTTLPIQEIRRDGGTQPRDRLSESTVEDYVEALRRGEALPPVTVFFDGAAYWLADGFHRVAAHAALGRSDIKAEVHQGARRDAILFSTGANAQHGLPRSNEDKRRAVLTLLRDPEWAGWSNGKIAAACRVSDDLVRKLRASLSPPERAGDGEHRSGDDARMRRNAAGDEPAAAGERAGAAAATIAATPETRADEPRVAAAPPDGGESEYVEGTEAEAETETGVDTDAVGAPSANEASSPSGTATDAIPAQALRSEMTLAQIGALAWRAYEQHHSGLAQAGHPAARHFVEEDRRRCAGWFADAVREMLDDIFDGPYASAAAPAIRAEIHRAMERLAAVIGEPVDPAPGVHTVGDLARRLNATGLPWPTVAERGGLEPAAFKRLLEGSPERRLSRPEKRRVGRLFPPPPPAALIDRAARAGRAPG